MTTEFGEIMGKELAAWGSDDPVIKGVKEKKEKVVKYTADVSDCDMVITRILNGKEAAKLFIFMSQTNENGGAIAFIKKMRGGTRDVLTEANARAFFDGLSSYYHDIFETGSKYIPTIRRDTKFLRMLVDYLNNSTKVSCTRKGLLTPDLIWEYKQSDYRNSVPWYADDEAEYHYSYIPTKFHERVWQHMLSVVEEKENITRDVALKKVFCGREDKGAKYRDAPIFEFFADIFDDFCAIKWFDEYIDNARLFGLGENSYSYRSASERIVRLFTIRIMEENDGEDGRPRYRGGYYGNDYIWKNAVDDMKQQVPFFIRFDKNRFWNYLQHSICLGLGSNLSEYIHTWRDYLTSAYDCDGKVKDKYPEHLQEAHDVYGEKARIIKEFKEKNALKEITETPAELCDMVHDKMQLITLRTAEQYATEAQQNANCVATYVNNTLTGRSWVCSFRSASSDTTLLTVEVNKLGEMCQIKGKYNRNPTTKELKQLSWFQKEIFKRMADKEMPFGQIPYEMLQAMNAENDKEE